MIKKLVMITALAMLLASSNSHAFITGNNLVEYCDDYEQDGGSFRGGYCYGYVGGIAQTLDWVSDKNRICASENVTQKQVVSIVRKYMEEHPEMLHERADMLVIIALRIAFPCSE
ncbi:Rap1a/Tai family immunity protein [Pseudomonadales bacterium]|nr:Rap1a/Tai family immunity protein [Pseudomonadales bacterium]